MDKDEIDLLLRARTTFTELLNNIPGLRLDWVEEPRAPAAGAPAVGDEPLPDLVARLTHESRVYTLAVTAKAQGFPKQLRQALDQLFRYRYKAKLAHDLIVAAPYITPEGGKVCQDDGVSYFDLAGNCRIALPSIYIERTGIPNPFQKTPSASPGLYGMRAERILRILLSSPYTPWKVIPLATHAEVSAGTVSMVRQMLLAREWAKEMADGLVLTQPQALLRDWAPIWKRRPLRPARYFTRLPLEHFEHKLTAFAREQKRPLALTGLAAAWRYAPMTRYTHTQAYWDGYPDEVSRALDLKETDSGANVHLLRPRDVGVLADLQHFNHVPVVCPVQAYLDTLRDPARGEEAAEHLWNTVLFRA